jgi:hypothetical protein
MLQDLALYASDYSVAHLKPLLKRLAVVTILKPWVLACNCIGIFTQVNLMTTDLNLEVFIQVTSSARFSPIGAWL